MKNANKGKTKKLMEPFLQQLAGKNFLLPFSRNGILFFLYYFIIQYPQTVSCLPTYLRKKK